MKNNIIFGMGIFHTPNRLKVLGQAKINVRQMSRGDSFGCVIFKILWDNGAKTQPRQNTAQVILQTLQIGNQYDNKASQKIRDQKKNERTNSPYNDVSRLSPRSLQ